MARYSKPTKPSKFTFKREDLDDSELSDIANKVGDYIRAARQAKGNLPSRWQANEDCYHCNNSTSVVIASEGGAEELPIWQSKCDRISGDVHRQMTAVYPTVQCIDESAEGRNSDDVENTLTILSERARYSKDHLRDVVFDALNTNNAWLRIRPDVDDASGEVCGFDMDTIHPSNMYVHPVAIQHPSQALMIAHGFNLMQWEVQSRIDDKTYLDPGTEVLGSDEYIGGYSQHESEGASLSDDQMEQETRPVGKEDSNVILFEVIVKLKLKADDQYRRYLLVYWEDGNKVLDIQGYGASRNGDIEEYPEPWYVKYCVKRSRSRIWSAWAPANAMQMIQSDISNLKEMSIQGTEFACLPILYINGQATLAVKELKYRAGTLLELPGDMKVGAINNSYNPGMTEPMLNLLGEVSDASTGVSRLGTSENLPASTSATAAAGFLQAQSEAKSDYASIIADGVESTWQVMFWILQIHADTIVKHNKNRLPTELTAKTIRALSLRFEATGTSGASSPQTYIQKLGMVKQLTQNDPAYDQNKINTKIIQLLDLPIQEEALLNDQLLIHEEAMKMLLGPPFWFTPEEIALHLAQKMQQRDAMAQVQQSLARMDPQQREALMAAQQQRAQALAAQNPNGVPNQEPAPTGNALPGPGPVQSPGLQPPQMGPSGGPQQMAGSAEPDAAPG